MSTTICWRQSTVVDNRFKSGTSSSLAVLKTVFNGHIEKTDIPALEAMAVAANDPFYNEVAAVVQEFGAIDFWGEF